MIEGFPDQTEVKKSENELNKEKIISLATLLSRQSEKLSFSGIDPEFYSKMKADEEEFPCNVTPIDEIIERIKNEGMKVLFGKNPETGNVYILPKGSNDIENDSIAPKYLQISNEMSADLKELILADRK
jgi:hypothetical protein